MTLATSHCCCLNSRMRDQGATMNFGSTKIWKESFANSAAGIVEVLGGTPHFEAVNEDRVESYSNLLIRMRLCREQRGRKSPSSTYSRRS